MSETRYVQPGWFTRNVFNRAVRRLTRWGISVAGSRELRVRGRSSGVWRSTPVNLLVIDGERYLVAPRGVTQWVRNIRVNPAADMATVFENVPDWPSANDKTAMLVKPGLRAMIRMP